MNKSENINSKNSYKNVSEPPGGAGVRAARNSVYLMGAQLASRLLGMIISIWLAHYLGDTVFGRYVFIITIVGFARIASNFGMDQVLIRAVAKDRERSNIYLGSGLISRFGIFILGFIPLLIFIALIDKPPDLEMGMVIGYLAVVFISMNQTFDNVFNGFERFGFPAAMQLAAKIVQIGLIVAAIQLNLGLLWIVSTLVISELVRALFLWTASLKNWGVPHVTVDMIRRLTFQSVPFVGITILSMIQSRSDVIILGLFSEDEVVGWYGAAINLMFAFLIISSSASNALFPVFSRLSGSDKKEKMISVYHKSVKLLLILGLPVALSITMLSGRIISLLYPETFKPAALVLAITIWAIPVIFVNSTIIRIINAFHREKKLFMIVLICAVTGVIVNIILIPPFAEIGAAITNLFIASLSTVLCVIVVEKSILKLKYPVKSLLKAALALIAMAGCIILLKNASWFLLIPAGAAVYAAGILLFRVIDPDELKLIWNVFIPGRRVTKEMITGDKNDENP